MFSFLESFEMLIHDDHCDIRKDFLPCPAGPDFSYFTMVIDAFSRFPDPLFERSFLVFESSKAGPSPVRTVQGAKQERYSTYQNCAQRQNRISPLRHQGGSDSIAIIYIYIERVYKMWKIMV